MLRSAVCATLFSLPALGAIYESPLTIDDEDDLRSAMERGEISDATGQTLIELLEDGVDLNRAGREELYELPSLTYADVDEIVAYRKNEGHLEDPAVLVAAGIITPEQLNQIAAFLLIGAEPTKIPLGGYYRLLGMYTAGDPIAPPAAAQLKLKGPFALSGGLLAAFTRRRVTSPFFDETRQTHCSGSSSPCNPTGALGTIGVYPEGYQVNVPKFYVQWKSSRLRVLAGTFRIGFGQRLTLDNTTRYNPKGITPDEVVYIPRDLTGICRLSAGEFPTGTPLCVEDRYTTPDIIWRDPFRGVAFSAEDLELGTTAKTSLYAFASYQTRSVYQYELFDHRDCDDPRNDTNDLCKAPNVYVDPGTGDPQRARLKFATLANLWDELAAGGRAELQPVPMFEIAITGYGAAPRWHVQPMQLDFQEYSKYPFGGPWGALGADVRVTLGSWNLYLEVARSFDSEPGGGGGWGAVQRSVWGRGKRELEITTRLYDVRFINPYARPVSSADEVDGQRARDEAGVRIKYTDRSLGDFQVRGVVDYAVLPWDQKGIEGTLLGTSNPGGFKAGTQNIDALIRGDYKGWSFFEPSLWFEYRNKDLLNLNGDPDDPQVGRCFTSVDGRAPPQIEGQPQLCIGERYRLGAQLRFRPLRKKLEIALTYVHDLVSDIDYTDKLSQDVRFTAEIRSQPIDALLFRLRSRYLKGDIFSNDRLEESLWSFLEVTYTGLKWLRPTVRYDVYVWLDKRQGTLDRIPNPEHRFRLELEGRF
ncbi:MAG: helix-hairpin-helix domain-containing protein [Archangiaceae bacterium]|nr:helix-hairpin-helix domain-containing protein [Archangiaceae bacterium]